MAANPHTAWEDKLLVEAEARQRLLAVLLKHPKGSELWSEWIRAASALVERHAGEVLYPLQYVPEAIDRGEHEFFRHMVDNLRAKSALLERALQALTETG